MSLTKPLLSLLRPRAIAYASYVPGGALIADPSSTGPDVWPADPGSVQNAIANDGSSTAYGSWTPFVIPAFSTNVASTSSSGSGAGVLGSFSGTVVAGNFLLMIVTRQASDGATPTGWTSIKHDNWNGTNWLDVYWRVADGGANDTFASAHSSAAYAYSSYRFPNAVAGVVPAVISTGGTFAATATYDPDVVTKPGRFFSIYVACTNVNTTTSTRPANYTVELQSQGSASGFTLSTGLRGDAYGQSTENPGTGTFGAVGTGEAWTIAVPGQTYPTADTLIIGAIQGAAATIQWQIGAGVAGAEVVRGTFSKIGSGEIAPMAAAVKISANEPVSLRMTGTTAQSFGLHVIPVDNVA